MEEFAFCRLPTAPAFLFSLVPGFVDEPSGCQPGHHSAQLGANTLDLMLFRLSCEFCKPLASIAGFFHPLMRERAGLNLRQDSPHTPLGLIVNDRWATRHIAVLRRVGDRIAHLG